MGLIKACSAWIVCMCCWCVSTSAVSAAYDPKLIVADVDKSENAMISDQPVNSTSLLVHTLRGRLRLHTK
jgi:hypothetical protein